MEITQLIDLESIAKQLKLPLPGVQRTAELLEEGNTVPFITRFRRDQTGGLDEQQIRVIATESKRAKLLSERKETILKSIESRGKLTDKLASQIKKARVLGDLEDIYLPYKPKKQSLASVARARGLEPFATAVLEAKEATPTLEERAAEFVNESKDVPNVEAALEGLKHLIAEYFGHNRQVRAHLRRHLSKNGKLVCKKIEQPVDSDEATDDTDGKGEVNVEDDTKSVTTEQVSEEQVSENPVATDEVATATDAKVADSTSSETQDVSAVAQPTETEVAAETPSPESDDEPDQSSGTTTESAPANVANEPEDISRSGAASEGEEKAEVTASPAAGSNEAASEVTTSSEVEAASDTSAEATTTPENPGATEAKVEEATASEAKSAETPDAADVASTPEVQEAQSEAKADDSASKKKSDKAAKKKDEAAKKKDEATSRRDQRREMRRRRRERLVQSFKDYFDFSDPIGRLPHHRILAINRGERTKVLRVRIECPDWDKVQTQTEKVAIREDHPYADFLRECLQDAMNRLLQPSIEREVRRDLNDRAEEHAVTVFARNLRKLLLQPPLRSHRVIAIDPGFRSGCKVVALDEFGRMLGHTFINLLSKEQQKQNGREALAKFVKEHNATVIAVGNGAASRETETLVAEVLSDELKDQRVGYLIVNEAGTSVYSTSELGREELPDVDSTVRSAVSIGRRALDPLSELVKIDPASIGVGLYQHDVKAKHLRESLDNVVESCVNYVGVDVNSASPALLGYVSGLNSLTARKIYEHRVANGPFKNREQLKDVSGIGDSTYVQAAGFLKVVGGENPLDGTWIHPESYDTAAKVLEAAGCSLEDLRTVKAPEPPAEKPADASDSVDSGEVTTSEATPQPEAKSEPDSNSEGETKEPPLEPAKEEAAAGPVASEQAAAPADSDAAPTAEAKPEEAKPEEAAKESSTSPEATDNTVVETATSENAREPTEKNVTEAVAASVATDGVVETSSPSETIPTSSARMQEVRGKLSSVDVDALAKQLKVGKLSLEDILSSLSRPGRDPREDLPPPIFRTGVLKLEDLKPEMELSGTVLNVVDFGAFVDIGLVDSGLIHVSRLADRYISDPHDVVSVGDILRVWVVEVDQKRRRVSLTAIEPGLRSLRHRKKIGVAAAEIETKAIATTRVVVVVDRHEVKDVRVERAKSSRRAKAAKGKSTAPRHLPSLSFQSRKRWKRAKNRCERSVT